MEGTQETSMDRPFAPCLGALLLAGTLCAGAARTQSPPAQSAPAQQAASSEADKPADTQNGTPPKKVYTNDDLKAMRGDNLSVTGNSGAQKKPTNSNSKNEQRNQAYWHNRAQKLRNQIAEVDQQIAQIKATAPPGGPANETANSSGGSSPIYFGGQGNRLRNLEVRKAALEKQMEELEEEARKAGVPPGWLR
jgi:hypothetical protein